jgi:hypothetical protein
MRPVNCWTKAIVEIATPRISVHATSSSLKIRSREFEGMKLI